VEAKILTQDQPGFGTMTYSSGEKYQGQWADDHKEGTGTFTWRQGQYLYSGQWKNNQAPAHLFT
jgi:hypothetical protein